MPPIDAKLILSMIGLALLVLGLRQSLGNGGLQLSGRTWLRVGLIFVAVAGWLWWTESGQTA